MCVLFCDCAFFDSEKYFGVGIKAQHGVIIRINKRIDLILSGKLKRNGVFVLGYQIDYCDISFYARQSIFGVKSFVLL